jgi:pimeloyl-ACP methyl ester carboxylesterase
MNTTTITAALLGVAMTVVASACGDSTTVNSATPTSAPTTTETAPTSTTAVRPNHLVDELVAIDHGRMHLRCVGTGDTTVMLIAGWDAGAESWGAIEPTLVEQARVCSYERFGTGTSDVPSTTQTFETQATDLHALLEAAGEPGPYILVGHSFGGAEAVTFASQYRDEVAGLMLLDATPATWPTTACSVPAWEGLCTLMHNPMSDPERVDVFPAFDAVAAITTLGELPMTVVTAAHRVDPSLTPQQLAPLDAAWADGVEQWASLSTASTVVTVQDTGHHIQLDQPALVIDQVEKLLP